MPRPHADQAPVVQSWRRRPLDARQQFTGRRPAGSRDLDQGEDAGHPLPVLPERPLGPVDLRAPRRIFLGEVRRLPQSLHVGADPLRERHPRASPTALRSARRRGEDEAAPHPQDEATRHQAGDRVLHLRRPAVLALQFVRSPRTRLLAQRRQDPAVDFLCIHHFLHPPFHRGRVR